MSQDVRFLNLGITRKGGFSGWERSILLKSGLRSRSRQAESGTSVAEIIRKLGVSEQTFYLWKKRFAGLGIAELRRLRIIEEEHQKLLAWESDGESHVVGRASRSARHVHRPRRPTRVGAWTSWPISWSAGSDSGC